MQAADGEAIDGKIVTCGKDADYPSKTPKPTVEIDSPWAFSMESPTLPCKGINSRFLAELRSADRRLCGPRLFSLHHRHLENPRRSPNRILRTSTTPPQDEEATRTAKAAVRATNYGLSVSCHFRTVIPHTTSLRGSAFEVAVPVSFLKPGAFLVQGVTTFPPVRALHRLGTLPAFARVFDGLLRWLGKPHEP
ncbi:MAG: hypothetical protein P4N24_08235 [Acidobacteriota bacterium]|nr:hypothetical protein [Acidobacteriota bacterium]